MSRRAVDTFWRGRVFNRMAPRRSADRVTMTRVAEAAGVNQSTVSLALRNHPRISPKTRRAIQRIAEKLGYRRDPKLGELMYHLKACGPRRYAETLAYIGDVATLPRWRPQGSFELQRKGARQQAEQLGYRLDEIWLGREGLTVARLDRVLRARRIRGLLLGSVRDDADLAALSWEQLAAVRMQFGGLLPAVHRVTSDLGQSMENVLVELDARGFRRIGLVSAPAQDDRLRHSWSSAYFGFHGRAGRVPLPVCPAQHEGKADLGAEARCVVDWFLCHRPEVILTSATDWVRVLGEHGFACPRDFSYVLLDLRPEGEFARWAGVDQHHELIGATAVNKLADCLTRGEFGVPEYPLSTLVPGELKAGVTLGRVASRTPRGTALA
jgi:LacI family transcriptional regulator